MVQRVRELAAAREATPLTGGEQVAIERDVEASVVPSGTRDAGERPDRHDYPVSRRHVYRGSKWQHVSHRRQGRCHRAGATHTAEQAGKAENAEDLEQQVWEQMKTCYDPEIPVNIVDLQLIYDCHLEELEAGITRPA